MSMVFAKFFYIRLGGNLAAETVLLGAPFSQSPIVDFPSKDRLLARLNHSRSKGSETSKTLGNQSGAAGARQGEKGLIWVPLGVAARGKRRAMGCGSPVFYSLTELSTNPSAQATALSLTPSHSIVHDSDGCWVTRIRSGALLEDVARKSIEYSPVGRTTEGAFASSLRGFAEWGE